MAAERPTQLLEVGRVAKAHGLRGEVIVELVTDRLERLQPGSVLWVERGPLEVVRAVRHQQRWRVAFAGIANRNEAEELAGAVLRAEPLDDPDALWAHELIGTEVVEVNGTRRGVVVALVANPAHDLLELDTGALVPVVFVQRSEGGVTVIDPPAGLFD